MFKSIKWKNIVEIISSDYLHVYEIVSRLTLPRLKPSFVFIIIIISSKGSFDFDPLCCFGSKAGLKQY